DAAFSRPTPAPGWSVGDQVSHLAYFDDAAAASCHSSEAFTPYLEEAVRGGTSFCDDVAARYRDRSPAQLRAWWASSRATMLAAMHDCAPSARVPWYGPEMSVASSLTARIMETWAHGQDVYDALGVEHPVTEALPDVVWLCARTRANSYAARGLSAPDVGVAVDVVLPGGDRVVHGEGTEVIRGDAVEFCLVATQRRHPGDTTLEASGPAAREWLDIAQAFAGPPGAGRSRSAA
ncbi:MAG TPA: TIGR03084 family metal-binding protein, partial [Acidimicrobiales bacterium]|nr:TIGR03084 family metal-binding protein [Acidimicrobiales bacterium]